MGVRCPPRATWPARPLPAIDRAIDEIGSGAQADTLDFDLRGVIAGLERELER